ncbi:hypothetical protein J7T55_004614 [Diaporthe amygdali]|uniref:uncharacterized protein n=1 Tax=Phomopsis amygdali TaxID=1214568 RepID=UPI0022FF353A|nr:uncharacterized protein J7T55_004614 [Diaporthe amygdali]KAJ0114872.1 hypothetical protein J7T55_004614 [Diaporthe amygdali]
MVSANNLHLLISVLIVCVTQHILQVQASPLHATVISRELANNTQQYDFIIAGGGIAGLTLADRLTENPEGNWWTAAEDIGVTPCEDPNAGNVKGIFWLRLSEDAVTRHRNHARINHYERVIATRPNYHLLPGTTVAKVLFEGTRAAGIELLPTTGGNITAVRASKEVILAAGGLHTPHILQLSGLGPAPLLTSFGIDVVSNLPGVGQNFQDQPTITMSYNFSNNVEPNWNSLLDNATYDAEQFALYNTSHPGPYTITRTLSTNFISLPLRNLTSKFDSIVDPARDISSPGAFLPPDTDPTVVAGYTKQREIMIDQLEKDISVGGLHWGTANTGTLYLFKPFSRGTVNINSTDPLTNPIVDFRAATDPTDLDVAVALVRKARDIMDAPSMRVLGPTELTPFGQDVQTDDEVKEAIRQTLTPSNGHECCTAAMMPRELGGVVDDQLKIYGVEGLRVADISFWPMPLNGAPSATVYATAELLADMIKDEHELQ